ncbi:hypothetical protein EUTSA_v10009229mg [Eutrema salsugineum]|uniref:Uncharacterized protein n=1 Tax=Eutrema salsugineum TaxID=72664 RepID=V4K7D7_EUTSA|nr:hypothetical protein EUTSA_v10009229mg [Eutrema salsugineum]
MPSSPSQSVRSKRRTVSKKISPRKRLSVESKSHPPSKMSKVASVSASISNVNASNGELVASISKVLVPSACKGLMVAQKPSNSQ